MFFYHALKRPLLNHASKAITGQRYAKGHLLQGTVIKLFQPAFSRAEATIDDPDVLAQFCPTDED